MVCRPLMPTPTIGESVDPGPPMEEDFAMLEDAAAEIERSKDLLARLEKDYPMTHGLMTDKT